MTSYEIRVEKRLTVFVSIEKKLKLFFSLSLNTWLKDDVATVGAVRCVCVFSYVRNCFYCFAFRSYVYDAKIFVLCRNWESFDEAIAKAHFPNNWKHNHSWLRVYVDVWTFFAYASVDTRITAFAATAAAAATSTIVTSTRRLAESRFKYRSNCSSVHRLAIYCT